MGRSEDYKRLYELFDLLDSAAAIVVIGIKPGSNDELYANLIPLDKSITLTEIASLLRTLAYQCQKADQIPIGGIPGSARTN